MDFVQPVFSRQRRVDEAGRERRDEGEFFNGRGHAGNLGAVRRDSESILSERLPQVAPG